MALRQCAQFLQQGWALLPDGDQLVAQGPVAADPDRISTLAGGGIHPRRKVAEAALQLA